MFVLERFQIEISWRNSLSTNVSFDSFSNWNFDRLENHRQYLSSRLIVDCSISVVPVLVSFDMIFHFPFSFVFCACAPVHIIMYYVARSYSIRCSLLKLSQLFNVPHWTMYFNSLMVIFVCRYVNMLSKQKQIKNGYSGRGEGGGEGIENSYNS